MIVWVLLAAMFVMGAGGCAGGDDSGDYEEAWGLDASNAAPTAAPSAMQYASLEGANQGVALQMKDTAESDSSTSSPQMAPTATPSPAAARVADADESGEALKVQASPQVQTRVIVHTAYMSLVVGDIAGSVDWITGLAATLGGWVVSSDRTSLHGGAVSIRVPAASLEDALSQMEGMAVEVESRTITSQDVTDQYVDYQSRLVSMKATEQRLLSFLDEAIDVEDALEVHKELAGLQAGIEEIQGRINFLEQTSAFSLIEVTLSLTPQIIQVDAGEDMAVRVGKNARFRASFAPPEGIDEYQFTWDFGGRHVGRRKRHDSTPRRAAGDGYGQSRLRG